MARHHQRPKLPDLKGRQIFGGAGRRGRFVAALLVLLFGAIGSLLWSAQALADRPDHLSPYHSTESFLDTMVRAERRCGMAPVIGEGIFGKVVELHRADGEVYGSDVFWGGKPRKLTRLEVTQVRNCPYAIDLFGIMPANKIALTFDDGPNPTWTPQILERLGTNWAHGPVKATFFVTGQNVALNPDLYRQTIAAGHLVGNHTLTHPQVSRVSATQARREFAATDHILATAGGYHASYGRLPYGGGDPVSLSENFRGIAAAQALGIVNAGFTYDVADFRDNGKEPLPDPHLRGQGEVIVMHDAGGNRAPTADLVVRIIQQAEAKGYEFIRLDQIPGAPTADTGPRTWLDIPAYAQYRAKYALPAVLSQIVLGSITAFFALLGIASMTIALWQSHRMSRERKKTTVEWSWLQDGRVFVVVAAYNEERTIAHLVDSIYARKYPFPLRIVIVDDGSTDRTWEVIAGLAKRYVAAGRDFVGIHRENSGKTAALNFAMQERHQPKQEYVGTQLRPGEYYVGGRYHDIQLFFDADGIVEMPTIERMVLAFRNPLVGMVAGCIEVMNTIRKPTPAKLREAWRAVDVAQDARCRRCRLAGKYVMEMINLLLESVLVAFQAADYVLGQGIPRMMQAFFRCVTTVPGASGGIRDRIMKSLGQYPEGTLAEDSDLATIVARNGWEVISTLAWVKTEAPATLRQLWRQRTRWSYGIWQVLVKHAGAIRKGNALSGMLALSMLGIIVPMALMPLVYGIMFAALRSGRGPMVLGYFLFFTSLEVIMTVVAMIALRRWSWLAFIGAFIFLLVNVPLQVGLMIRIIWLISRGQVAKWGQQHRQGAAGFGIDVGAADGPDDLDGQIAGPKGLVPVP